jgi:hypothetical protein
MNDYEKEVDMIMDDILLHVQELPLKPQSKLVLSEVISKYYYEMLSNHMNGSYIEQEDNDD